MAARLQETLEGLRHEKERAEQSEGHHREFLADISHSLGTPLAAVQGWIHAMQDGIIGRRLLRHFTKIAARRPSCRGGEAAAGAVALGTGRPELVVSEFPLLDPALEAVESLEESLLHAAWSSPSPVWTGQCESGGPGRVEELFQILLENCVAHAGEGTSVSLVADNQEGRLVVCVATTDAG